MQNFADVLLVANAAVLRQAGCGLRFSTISEAGSNSRPDWKVLVLERLDAPFDRAEEPGAFGVRFIEWSVVGLVRGAGVTPENNLTVPFYE